MTIKSRILVIAALLIFLSLTLINLSDDYSQVALVTSPYLYNFNVPGILDEAGSMAESDSPYWWLNSGGVMSISENMGRTNQGELSPLSKWRIRYKISSSVDTDDGYHPQNLFRLVSRNVWKNLSIQAYFRVVKDNLSESYNRNISNGLFLMSRYQDHNNLYYTGIRVDGTAVIKKKRDGEYITLAQERIWEGEYDRENNPDLIPKNKWIGIKSEIITEGESVRIRMYLDKENNGKWTLVLETSDTERSTQSLPIFEQGYVGIRTDFMDVEFRDFQVREI